MLFMLAGLLMLMARDASATDLHALWHERCQGCHGHAAAFARERSSLDEQRLGVFLRRHRGGLPENLAAGMAAMLAATAAAPDRFMQECRICHSRAADFARDHLAVRDDTLVGRYSGRDVAEFLDGHARLDADGAAFFTDQLRRIVGEVRFGE